MELAMIGLGRMGGNMLQRLLQGGHRVVAYARTAATVQQAEAEGAVGVGSLAEVAAALHMPRIIWMMVPAGAAVDQTIASLLPHLSAGDILVDGGNSNYKDSMRRAAEVKAKGFHFIDVGTSGGIWGLREGYCLMIGGDEEPVRQVEPIFASLASPGGYAHVGPSGAGHFVKMVHNGIEYGMMQAYAEGFELMEAKKEFALNMAQIADVWRYGSVVRSWLLDLAVVALREDPKLETLEAYVDDSGEGRWFVHESVELAVPTLVITVALQSRFRSRQNQPFGAKLLAALRAQFGGHSVRRKE